jgi:hypothetical protein
MEPKPAEDRDDGSSLPSEDNRTATAAARRLERATAAVSADQSSESAKDSADSGSSAVDEELSEASEYDESSEAAGVVDLKKPVKRKRQLPTLEEKEQEKKKRVVVRTKKKERKKHVSSRRGDAPSTNATGDEEIDSRSDAAGQGETTHRRKAARKSTAPTVLFQ